MKYLLSALIICAFLTGCSSVPIKDGEIYIGKDTSTGMKDMSVGNVTKKF